jgi:release factor glutamine methyltransferase
MATVRELLQAGRSLPGDRGRRDAEILLCHCLDKPRAWLYTWPDAEIEEPRRECFDQLLARRREGQPVAYLTGRREFWSLELAVDESTLIPRPETETLVAWALELDLPADCSAADLGTGSGAIALALAGERPAWRITATDASDAALAMARGNARALGLDAVEFRHSDWFAGLADDRFDLLLSNPPYIEDDDPHLEEGDLRFEPRSALVAGQGGLADIAAIVGAAPGHLVPGGWLLLEHGFSQGEAVRALFRRAGFDSVETRRDLAGLERATGGRRHAQ